jgi:hypothetical protein
MAINRPIRITDTALGTIWIDCYKPEALDLRPWWHGTSPLDGLGMPFFTVTLRRFEGRWALAEFHDHYKPGALEWPSGAREKVPEIVREIGAAWAAGHESYICERATNYLKLEVKRPCSTGRIYHRSGKPLRTRNRSIEWTCSSRSSRASARSSVSSRASTADSTIARQHSPLGVRRSLSGSARLRVFPREPN